MASEKEKSFLEQLYKYAYEKINSDNLYGSYTEKGMWKRFHDAYAKGNLKIAAKVFRTLEEDNYHTLTDRMTKALGAAPEELDRLFKNYEKDEEARQRGKISYDEMSAAGEIGKPSAVETKESEQRKTYVTINKDRVKGLSFRGRKMSKEDFEKAKQYASRAKGLSIG